jgi:hypothetical protein
MFADAYYTAGRLTGTVLIVLLVVLVLRDLVQRWRRWRRRPSRA